MSEHLDPRQFAAGVNELTSQRVSADRITYACRAGTIRALRIGGRWSIPASELNHYVVSNERKEHKP
jgi:hypothetical protein